MTRAEAFKFLDNFTWRVTGHQLRLKDIPKNRYEELKDVFDFLGLGFDADHAGHTAKQSEKIVNFNTSRSQFARVGYAPKVIDMNAQDSSQAPEVQA